MRNNIIYQNEKRLMLTTRWEENVKFCRLILYYTSYSMLILSVAVLLLILQAGDVHPNPGLQSTESSASSSTTYDIYKFLNLPNYLSTVHYNVQSIANKLDTLIAEFYFDIMSFPETWLHNGYSTNKLIVPSFHPLSGKTELMIDTVVLFYMLRIPCHMSEGTISSLTDLSVFGYKSSLAIIGISCMVYSTGHRTLTLIITHLSKIQLALLWTLVFLISYSPAILT